jgi:hypothetical protein
MNQNKHEELLHTRINDLECTLSQYSSIVAQWEKDIQALEVENGESYIN